MNGGFWKSSRKMGRAGFHGGQGELADKLKKELPQQAAQNREKLKKEEKSEKKASEDKIPGGLADHKSDKDFAGKDLKAGEKVEREHTKDPSIAREIAKDHLAEDKDYYEKLKKVEKKH